MMPNKETGSSRQNGKRPADNENSGQQSMGRSFQRHTPHQVQELEAFFQRCSHPDIKQRMRISEGLGIPPDKVMFWFQNRRTQMKVATLKRENDNLKREKLQLNEVRENHTNLNYSSDDQQDAHRLSLENTRLKEDVHRLSLENMRLKKEYVRFRDITSRYAVAVPTAEPATSSLLPGEHIGDDDKVLVQHHAFIILRELRMMCEAADELLWNRGSDGKEVLNLHEYSNRMFSEEILSHENMRIEASRGSTVVLMNSDALVERFCDADKWMEMFPSIVSKAQTLQTVDQGPSGNHNGSLRLMSAEIQMLSPLVHPREVRFIRYCQKDELDGSWGIVDFPLDSLMGYTSASPFPKCRRKPSGCIIEDTPRYGCSKVTWLEHMEVENRPLHHIINQFVSSGVAFGAERWLSVLKRQGERLYSLAEENKSDSGVRSPEAKSFLMNLAERMMRSFCLSLSGSRGQPWMTLSDSPEDTVRISTRSSTEPGHPIGLILRAASTTRLPYRHLQVFDLVRDIRRRTQIMEVRSSGNSIYELITNIASGGSQPGNSISLFRIDHPMQGSISSSSQNAEYVLQESYSNESESVVAYTTLEVEGVMLGRADPSTTPILPIGFIMVPVIQTNSTEECSTSTGNIGQNSGCFLTVALQTLVSNNPFDDLNLFRAIALHSQLHNIVDEIKMALSGASGLSNVMGIVDHQ